jgi:Zn-dependent protease with chaperone function
MPFLLLLILPLTCVEGQWPPPPTWLGPEGSALFAGLGALLLSGLAWLQTVHFRRRLRLQPLHRQPIGRRSNAWRRYQMFALIGFHLLVVYGAGWGCVIRDSLPLGEHAFPGAELLVLAPFLTALVLSWAAYYGLERDLHATSPGPSRPFMGRGAFVALQARHNLLLVVPPLLLLALQQGLLKVFPDLDRAPLFPLLALFLVAGAFMAIPWLLRLLLGLTPLPEGPLRDRLLAAARRLKFRCNDILVWNTNDAVANAMVTGILPVLRYVVLTDRLIHDLAPDEVEAVFGHEVGHVKHQHLLFYFGFLIVSLVVVIGVWTAAEQLFTHTPPSFVQGYLPGLGEWLRAYPIVAELPLLAMLCLYIFVVFGFLSRRCERQADIYGCRTVSCERSPCAGHGAFDGPTPLGRGLCTTGIHTFISALEKVAVSNGIHRERPGWLSSWQHSTIALRVAFLQRLCSDPAAEPRFQRRVVLVKCALLLGLAAVVLLLFLTPEPRKLWAEVWKKL